jgi:hypothetical protein
MGGVGRPVLEAPSVFERLRLQGVGLIRCVWGVLVVSLCMSNVVVMLTVNPATVRLPAGIC